VVEGVGTNGLEYMTGGTAVILGPVGETFAAGMTGGMAFVLDLADRFRGCVNPDSVVVQRLASPHWEEVLKKLVREHAHETGSAFAEGLLRDWERTRGQFWQVCPKEMIGRIDHPLQAEETAYERA
jgi:glutamate synthase (NADPH/NADH) large chain